MISVVAVETLQGPVIPWRPGRLDVNSGAHPDNLPYGTENIYELRTKVFNRMGFGDKELVALQGGHCLGRNFKILDCALLSCE